MGRIEYFKVALPTIKIMNELYFIDFRLGEIRLCDNPHYVIPFAEIGDEYRAKIRGIRSERGPNVYIKGLDD